MYWLCLLHLIAFVAGSPFPPAATKEEGHCYTCPITPPPGQSCCGADDTKFGKTCGDGSACCACGDDIFGCLCPEIPPTPPAPGQKGILVAGDSWGTEGGQAFHDMITTKSKVNATIYNIAVMGSTASDWEKGDFLSKLQEYAKLSDYIWLTLMGNDLFSILPACAILHRNDSDACGASAQKTIIPRMQKVLTEIHSVNPNARVIGFGYDLLGLGSPWCLPMTDALFPQCRDAKRSPSITHAECFNTQFIRMQAVWEILAKEFDFVDVIDLLGTLQAAGGNKDASTGHPDLKSWGPAKLTELNCEHATPGKNGGFSDLFEKMWELYWSKHLGGENAASVLV